MSKKWNGKVTTEHRHRWPNSIRRPWFHVFHVQNTFTVKTPAKLLSAAQASNTSIPLPPFTRHCEFSWNSRKPSVKFFYCKVTERKSFPQKHFSQNSAFFTDCGKKNKQFWVWKRNWCRGLDICLSSKRSLVLFQQETQMPSRLSQESLRTQTWSVLSLHSLKRPAGADSSSCKQSASREEKFSYHWNAK